MSTEGSKQGTQRSGRWLVLPWLIALVGVAASIFLFVALHNAVENRAHLRFDRQASEAENMIEGRIQSYAGVLYGLKGLFASQSAVDRAQFHRFVDALDLKRRFPGLSVVNFAAYVPAAERERFVKSVRSDTSLVPTGYPDFDIKPPGARLEYFVLSHVEPMAGFEQSFGRDIGAQPGVPNPEVLLAALRSARDSGKLTASGVPLRIKSEPEVVLAMRLPVYNRGMPVETVEQRRAAYVGSVGGAFNIEALMKDVFSDDVLRSMRYSMYDVGFTRAGRSEAEKPRLLFDSSQLAGAALTDPSSVDTRSSFTSVLPFEVGGRLWQLHFVAPKQAVMAGLDMLLPWIVLAGGITFTLLLSRMVFSLASSRGRVMEIARHITTDLRLSEASLAEAQRIAHLGNWSFDVSTLLMTWSAETYRIFGIEPGAQRIPFSEFLQRVHDEDRARVERALVGGIDRGEHGEIEHRIVLPNGTARWVHTIVQGDSDSPVPGIVMDITERKLAEQDLVENRALLNDAQKLSHVGCCLYNPADGRVIWSEELYRIHGVDPRIFGPSYATAMDLVHPDDRVAWEETLMAALVDGQPFSREFRIVRADGTVRHLRSLGEVIQDPMGRPLRMLWSVLDITEQKHTEGALRASAEQLTALSRRLVEIQETERRQLSRELHDRVGQNLTALSINLDMLRTTLSGDHFAEHRARLADSSALLESTVDSIENVMAELRPPMLDDYGLLPALHWYAKDFSKRTGMAVAVTGDDSVEHAQSEMEITLFRIAQEALTNVAKHAHAKHVEIALEYSNSHCVMTVTDDGIGFDAGSTAVGQQRSALGVVTMRERAQAIGGRFDVLAVPGGGTQIAIRIP